VAAIPVRRTERLGLEVLLVTSRETHRWVVPKGWPWPNADDQVAAAGEAWEEAGVRGRVAPASIGTFTYDKRLKKGAVPLEVTVYLLDVDEMADNWPEKKERHRQWFALDAAVELVAEEGLKAILQRLGV
jgi:8-oxo-dGTP pyrophosphatase MutT (NUDIX family)